MDFVAPDVETANADMASICQIGAARYSNGTITDEWRTNVDPQDYFDAINVSIHGIDESMVVGAPTFPQIAGTLARFLGNSIVVTHTHFDRTALRQASHRYGLDDLVCGWLDSARVARWLQAWLQSRTLSNDRYRRFADTANR